MKTITEAQRIRLLTYAAVVLLLFGGVSTHSWWPVAAAAALIGVAPPPAVRFEDAARLRDQVRAIEKSAQKQQVLSHGGGNEDVFGLYREGGFVEAQVLFVRGGRLVGHESFGWADRELPDDGCLLAISQGNPRCIPYDLATM